MSNGQAIRQAERPQAAFETSDFFSPAFCDEPAMSCSICAIRADDAAVEGQKRPPAHLPKLPRIADFALGRRRAKQHSLPRGKYW